LKDGKDAADQAGKIKQPPGGIIYFAAEGLPHGYDENDLPGVIEYFKGVKEGVGTKYQLGIYGDGVVCGGLLGTYCKYAWIAAASYTHPGTTEFYKSKKWALAQKSINHEWEQDLSVDYDEANGEYGAFSVPIV
jgi:Domain of unknown function (DUF1906)